MKEFIEALKHTTNPGGVGFIVFIITTVVVMLGIEHFVVNRKRRK